MDLIVNEFDLKNPPLITLPTKNKDIVQSLYSIFRSFSDDKNLRNELSEEAALLGRIMARRNNSFRNQLLFRSVHKLNASLCRLLRLDIERTIENFSSILELGEYDGTAVSIPTRDSLVYVLIRLLGVHKLYERIQQCCVETFERTIKLLQTNFFLEINVTLLALTARLRSIVLILANNCAKIYNQLFRYQQHVPTNKDSPSLLPKGLKLPEALEVFGQDYSDDQKAKHITLEDKASNFLSRKPKTKTDTGVKIERQKCNVILFPKLDTCEAVERFIKEEDEARRNKRTKYTKSILDHEWKGAVKIFHKKLETNKKKALFMFQSFLNSKI